jgi:hypothetical protein
VFRNAPVVRDGGAAHVEDPAEPRIADLDAWRCFRELHCRHHVHGDACGANGIALGLEATGQVHRELAVHGSTQLCKSARRIGRRNIESSSSLSTQTDLVSLHFICIPASQNLLT